MAWGYMWALRVNLLGWRNGSVGMALGLQVQGPELDPQNLCQKSRCGGAHLWALSTGEVETGMTLGFAIILPCLGGELQMPIKDLGTKGEKKRMESG